MLLLAIIIVSVVGAFMAARLSVERSKNRTKAMNLLRSRMEWVKAQNPDTIGGWIAAPLPVENNVDNVIGQDDLVNDTRTTTVATDINGNYVVTITLNWEKRTMGGAIPKGTAGNPDLQLVTVISP